MRSRRPVGSDFLSSRDRLFEAGGDSIFQTVMTVTTSSNRRGVSWSSVSTKHYGFLTVARVKEVQTLARETLIDPFVDRLQMASS